MFCKFDIIHFTIGNKTHSNVTKIKLKCQEHNHHYYQFQKPYELIIWFLVERSKPKLHFYKILVNNQKV